MTFDNYTDEHNNIVFVENNSILYIEIKNDKNHSFNSLCLESNFFEQTNDNLNIYKFESFEIFESKTEDINVKHFILQIEEYEIIIFKNKLVSLVDDMLAKVEKYKSEVGNLSNEAANLQDMANSQSQSKSKSKVKVKTKTKHRNPSK